MLMLTVLYYFPLCCPVAGQPEVFDHTIVNDTVERAYDQLKEVMTKVATIELYTLITIYNSPYYSK